MKVKVESNETKLNGVITGYHFFGVILDEEGEQIADYNQNIGEAKTQLIKEGVLDLSDVEDNWGMEYKARYLKAQAASKPVTSQASASHEVINSTAADVKIESLLAANKSIVDKFERDEKSDKSDHTESQKTERELMGEDFVPTDYIPGPESAAVTKARRNLSALQTI